LSATIRASRISLSGLLPLGSFLRAVIHRSPWAGLTRSSIFLFEKRARVRQAHQRTVRQTMIAF
jgi:hypothetical protein